MNEIVLKIREDGTVSVEDRKNGIQSYKVIEPNALLSCIKQSILREGISSGLLPMGCLSYKELDSSEKEISLLYPEDKADITYYGSLYKDFPLPKLVFKFRIGQEGQVFQCGMGIVADEKPLKPTTQMYTYPFSNVTGFHLCTGNNVLPKCKSLHTLGSLPYYILSMDNNNDYFKPSNNKLNLEMRDLLECIKDKPSAFYYSDVLVPNNKTLQDFIQ